MIKDKCERCYEVYGWVKTDEDLDKYEDKLLMKLIKMWEQNDTIFKIYEVNGKYNLYANGYFECRKDTVNECEKRAFFIETILFPLKRL